MCRKVTARAARLAMDACETCGGRRISTQKGRTILGRGDQGVISDV